MKRDSSCRILKRMCALAIPFVLSMAFASACLAASVGAKGTTQMSGVWAQYNKPYSLGKGNKLNFTMKSAEFTVDAVRIGRRFYFPDGNEKLLVIHYTIQNPEKRQMSARWSSFQFTVVDQMNANHEAVRDMGHETTGDELRMDLKPAQKVEAFSIFKVPAKGQVPKLMVKRSVEPILRYDLRGKVKRLEPPFVDPSDPTGSSALSEVPSNKGTFYPVGYFMLRLDDVRPASGRILNRLPPEGAEYVEAIVTFKNPAPTERDVRWSTCTPAMTTTDGEECEWERIEV